MDAIYRATLPISLTPGHRLAVANRDSRMPFVHSRAVSETGCLGIEKCGIGIVSGTQAPSTAAPELSPPVLAVNTYLAVFSHTR